MPKEKEKTICGKTKKEIRKSYFDGKLKKLLSEIQSEEKWEEEEINKLGEFLEELRNEEKGFVEKVLESFGGKILEDDIKPPTTEKIFNNMNDTDKEEFKKWEDSVKQAKKQIGAIRKKANTAVFDNSILSKDSWSGWALQIETLKRWLSEDYHWKEQLYHKKICDIIDEYGTSRRESEDRAKITKEYFDYKSSKDEFDSLTEIVLICKKRGSSEYN